MTLIEYGVGTFTIGFTLTRVSYRQNTNYFVGKFFFSLFYTIFVIIVLGNIFLAVIVDTFDEIRHVENEKDHDKHNVCFICQISRDGSLNKNIDFEKHIKQDHLIWNYVYFLTYLHITNPNDFNVIQNYVWGKLSEADTTWLPSNSASTIEHEH